MTVVSGRDWTLKCARLSLAVFGDAEAVKFSPLSAKQRFTALSSGEIHPVTEYHLNQTRDTQLGLNFAGVNYYDGQGMMVPRHWALI